MIGLKSHPTEECRRLMIMDPIQAYLGANVDMNRQLRYGHYSDISVRLQRELDVPLFSLDI